VQVPALSSRTATHRRASAACPEAKRRDEDDSLGDILAFVASRQELEAQLPRLKEALAAKGKLWVAYHKGTSRMKTDINRDTMRAYAQTLGLEAVAIISVNEDWSALRLKVVG
jgi:hypothetical protein